MDPATEKLQNLAEISNFTEEEIKNLYKRFAKLDKDQSGTIDKEEFLSIPQLRNNPLAQRLIDVFDINNTGEVNFSEFIVRLSSFSSKGKKAEKLAFAFQIYDMDRDGFISNGELFLVLKMMVGNNLTPEQLQQIVDKTMADADTTGNGKINFEEFCNYVNRNDIVKQLTLEF
ncbi:hypothetical protein BB560_004070 [Smittium megazygosporum]|uniref:Calcineurin subunit B n=1 Tax=Smittium megazygosporum TaxID=133381 RepID=A0A2T9ZAC3_9FUNG|nr:hypothetical protein BB560_004070 [Smittium megazygosporum]